METLLEALLCTGAFVHPDVAWLRAKRKAQGLPEHFPDETYLALAKFVDQST